MNFNIDFVRKQFPGLSGDWTFFDNAGGAQIIKSVTDRICDYLLNTNVQLGATYGTSELAGERVADAHNQWATLLNAEKNSEIIIGPSSTALLRILAFSLAETFQPGDEIIVTNCDHEANIGPWKDIHKMGIKTKVWEVNKETLDLELDDLASLMNEKTRVVALTHASNILGTINPIKKIASFVHDHGALICVDGVAYAPHRHVDVKDLDVDFYAFSFYKTYGPHLALLYGKESHLLKMPGINHFFIGENEIPYKFQPGNVNFELAYGTLGICDYFREFEKIHSPDLNNQNLMNAAHDSYKIFSKYEETLSKRLLDYLNSKNNVRIIGKKEADRDLRVPTISFVVDNRKSSDITLEVDKFNIGIRYGDFYARRLIEDLGLMERDGVVRVSMVHYNTIDEVDSLINALETTI